MHRRNSCHVTTLLIRHVHKRLGHSERGHVISSLREKYWIINVNTAVRHVISKRVLCRRNYSRPNEQKMADLPKNLHRCRLLRTLHHQGRTQGSKTIRRSIHVFSQLSSPYWGGKFPWIKFIYSSTPALHRRRGLVRVTMAPISSVHGTSCSKP